VTVPDTTDPATTPDLNSEPEPRPAPAPTGPAEGVPGAEGGPEFEAEPEVDGRPGAEGGPNAEAAPDIEGRHDIEAGPDAEGGPDIEAGPDVEGGSGAEGGPDIKGRPDIEAEPEVEAGPDIEGGPDAEGWPDIEGGPGAEGGPEVDGGPGAEGGPDAEAGPDVKGRPDIEARPEVEAGPDIEGGRDVEGGPGGEVSFEGPADSDLPDLTEDADLEAALESLLLVVDSPAEDELLATALDVPPSRVTEALHRMAESYTERGRGIDLRHVGGGWRLYTRDRFAPFVEKLLHDGQRSRLTRAALETLAVIAYRQPVTRQRVAAVRGVNVDGVIRTLLARGLIEETGTDHETGGILYRTTELFLERIGLSSLDDLPPIAPLLPEVDAIDDV
jgi:segregation and condensation protein B